MKLIEILEGVMEEWKGMETQELRMDCGCELWTGVDHNDRPYILVEHCPKHYVRVHDLCVEKIEQESVEKG